MRKILAGLAVAAAGVVGVSGVAAAVDPPRDGPPRGTCVAEWLETHPDYAMTQSQYADYLYARADVLYERYIAFRDKNPADPRLPNLSVRYERRSAAYNWQRRNCGLPKDWHPTIP